MPTIAEDSNVSTNALTPPTRRLVTGDHAKTDMTHFAQLLRRSLSIADSDLGAADKTNASRTRPAATQPIILIPKPLPRPAFVLVSAPTPDQTNVNTKTQGIPATGSGPRPKPSVPSASYSQEQSTSCQNHDDRVLEVLRLLKNKEAFYKSLKEQMRKAEGDISTLENTVRALLNQDKETPNRNKNKKKKKKKIKFPTSEIAANTNANNGQRNKTLHPTVVPVTERRATALQPQAENKEATKNAPLSLAPAFLEAGQHPWEVYPGKCIRPFNWTVLDSPPAPPSSVLEPISCVQFPHPIFWTPSPSNPETIVRPNPSWTLGTFHPVEIKRAPWLSPRLLCVDNIPSARCNLCSLISWFQLFGALVYVEHGGSATGQAILEYADPLGAYRAMTCEFPAWGIITVSAEYTSLGKVKGYGKGREKGRTTIPRGGIQPGTSASDGMQGNRGVKRSIDETEIEDREVDAYLGVPVSLPRAPIAGPSRPGIMQRQWLTKVIDGQGYIIVDGDEDDPDIMEALPIKVRTTFRAKHKRRRRKIKRGPLEIELPAEMETLGREVDVNNVQDDDVEDDELHSSEDEDDGSSDSEASVVENT